VRGKEQAPPGGRKQGKGDARSPREPAATIVGVLRAATRARAANDPAG
jgi:hypothetical protein